MRITLLLAGLLCALVHAVHGDTELYDILGVKLSATDAQIKQAYRKLAKEFHPDKNSDPNAHDRFQDISEAYQILSDPDKRATYDTYGKEGLQQQEGGGGGGNPFDSFFGGGGGGRQQKQKGPEIRQPLPVTLEDLYLGKTIEVEIVNQQLCPNCRGTGANSKKDIFVCSHCKGSGVQIVRHQMAPGFFQQVQQTCPHCRGKGRQIKKSCSVCSGKKVVRGSNILKIDIEMGMADDQHLTFPRLGDQGPDHIAGDVVYVIDTQPHPVFERRGSHLYTHISVSLAEALLGFTKSILHLDSRVVAVKRKGITQPGQVITMPGLGMPKHHFPSEFGNLYVEVSVIFPRALSEEHAESLSKILQ